MTPNLLGVVFILTQKLAIPQASPSLINLKLLSLGDAFVTAQNSSHTAFQVNCKDTPVFS
ncbi:MAG: hypothetical protein SAK29_11415 [Scytonema sp. PMC 1069.18]|nr:hypothetical protein [Scytonema sp. PMC 1069.18]MEC4883605.1 hypothetical protein [Scytonema sp. PMC 1070.18]